LTAEERVEIAAGTGGVDAFVIDERTSKFSVSVLALAFAVPALLFGDGF
jgi:hypothetical protein